MNTLPIKNSGEMQRGDWLRILSLWALVMILRYGMFCVLLFLGVQKCLSQENQVSRPAFRAGEVLRYKVKWSFIRLGSLEVRQELCDSADGACYRIILTAESAQGLPFIDLYFVNRGKVSTETLESLDFTSDIGREKKNRSVHQTDTAAKILALAEFIDNNLIRSDTLHMNELVYDDPSLFMLIRCLAGSGETREVSSVMESRIETTTFRFPVAREEIQVAALDHPVSVFHFEGKANWTRNDYAGLRGEFCGWVSADSAAVPLRIEARIFLGSIVLELESYERPGWPVHDTLFSHVKK